MRLILLILALTVTACGARAASSPELRTPREVASIVSEPDSYKPGMPFRLALRLQLAKGWHSYWQNPGDAGAPPDLALTLSDGASAGPIAFPVPERTHEGPLVTYGYTGEVLFPLTVTPGMGGGTLHVEAEANWLACENICVPEHGHFALDLPEGDASPGAQAMLFSRSDAAMPQASPFAAHYAADGTLSVEGEGLTPQTVRQAWFIPASSGSIDNAADQALRVAPGKIALHLTWADGFAAKAPLSGLLVLEDAHGRRAGLNLVASPGGAPAPAVPQTGLAEALLLGLLAGLVLNLMPCVFPVLAMKAVALARLSGAARGQVRREAAFYAAGVLVAFAAIGLLLLALRAAGLASGWGFQFQSPGFVAVMAWLIFAMGLNLSGVFSFSGHFAGAGQALVARGGHAGSFFTGLLAVLVATPCTAPFMGAAVAAALLAGPLAALAIFLAMGLGLAAPAVLVAGVPALARALPRPGRWMEVLRQILAFPMYGTALWLLWVISRQSGADGMLAAGAGLLAVGFAAWSWRQAQLAHGGRILALVAAGLALLAALALLPVLQAIAPAAQAEASAGAEKFTAARLAALRAEGKPVFVNMTASWCVTCLVNERVALGGAVARAFSSGRIAYLKGDWTRQDPEITAYLRDQGRDGVPLYVYYPPGDAPPETLPQILTASMVLHRLGVEEGK